MKITLLLLATALGTMGWVYRDRWLPGAPAPIPAQAKLASMQRISDEEFAHRLQENVPTRVQLAKQYPDSYQRLRSQVRKDLRECIVTEVVPGVLKAECR